MNNEALLKTDYLDIIYNNRNKQYGGYELRLHYEQRMKRAALTVILLCGALGVYSMLTTKATEVAISTKPFVHEMSEVKIDVTPIHIEQPKPITAAPAVKPTVANPVPKVVPDDKVITTMPTINDIKGKESGLLNATGDPNSVVVATTTTTGAGTTVTPPVPKVPDAPIGYAEQMPEFVGNMSEFLQRNLNYPAAAKEAGITGSVVIQFVVNEDGEISNAKVLRGIGGGCNEEAIRVVKSMPKWKPGKQNGRAVKVYYTLPIRFVLQ
jgi:protein TonB